MTAQTVHVTADLVDLLGVPLSREVRVSFRVPRGAGTYGGVIGAGDQTFLFPSRHKVTAADNWHLDVAVPKSDQGGNPVAFSLIAEIETYTASGRVFLTCGPFEPTTDIDLSTVPDLVHGTTGVITVGGPKGDKGDPTTIVEGAGISVDDTDPANPIVSATFGGTYDELTGKPSIPSTPADIGAQPADTDLAAIAALAPADNDLVQRKAGSWTNRTPAQVKADLALTKSDVGLGSVDNTSDAAKPISTAATAALAAKADLVGGVIPTSQIPAIALTAGQAVANRAAMLALVNVQPGDVAVISGTSDKGTYILTATDPTVFANWLLMSAPTDVVTSVNGQAGIIVLGKSDVGLGNVDNTSDAGKPISTATATALAAKADLVAGTVPDAQIPDTGVAALVSASGSATHAALSATYATVFTPVGNTVTDTAALQAKINAGGRILVNAPLGVVVLNPFQIKTGAHIDLGGATLQLAAGANADLVTVPNFSTLTGSNGSGGESGFSFINGTLDGNGTHQSGTSWTFRVYGSNYKMRHIEIVNGYSGNVYSEWGTSGGGDMEAHWLDFKIRTPQSSGAVNVQWNGPHDSVFTQGEIVAGVSGYLQTGFAAQGNAGGEVFVGVHVWGYHGKGWIQDHSCTAVGCTSEGAQQVNLLARAGVGIRWQGRIYGTSDFHTGEVGVQIGDTGFSNVSSVYIDAQFQNFGPTSYPLDFFSSNGGNRIVGTWIKGTGVNLIKTAANVADNIQITGDSPAASLMQYGAGGSFNGKSQSALLVMAADNTVFEIFGGFNTLANFYKGTKLRGFTNLSNSTQTYEISAASGYIQSGTTTGVGAKRWSGSGAPTTPGGAITYNLGDVYERTDTPGTVGQRTYRVTTAGTSPTWTADEASLVPATRQIAGLDLSADRTASALKTALAITEADVTNLTTDLGNKQTKFVAGTCATAIGTTAKTVTIGGYTLTTGDVLAINFTNGVNVGAITLAVNGGSAISVLAAGATQVAALNVSAGAVVFLYYDGTNLQTVGTYNNGGAASQAEAEQGTVATPRFWTAQRVKQSVANAQINTQTGATYTFVATDAGCRVEGNNASAITFTIPPNSSVAFSIGTWIEVEQYGAGAITVAAGAGVTLRSRGALVNTNGQYSVVRLYKRATDEWVLSGDRV